MNRVELFAYLRDTFEATLDADYPARLKYRPTSALGLHSSIKLKVELPRFSGQFRAVVPSPEVGDSRWT